MTSVIDIRPSIDPIPLVRALAGLEVQGFYGADGAPTPLDTADLAISGVTVSSDDCESDWMFVAIPGLTQHGIRFAHAAIEAGAFAVIVGAPSSVADPSPDPDLAQSVAAHEEWSNEASEISAGHVDLGPRLIDGQWRAGLRHDAETGAVWRDPNQTVLRVRDAAIMTAPDNADYPFLADVAGKPVHVIPQTQNPSVVWLGWNTQDPAVTATIDRGLTMPVGIYIVKLDNGRAYKAAVR